MSLRFGLVESLADRSSLVANRWETRATNSATVRFTRDFAVIDQPTTRMATYEESGVSSEQIVR